MDLQQKTTEQTDDVLTNKRVIKGSRRLIREKVLQVLTAYFVSGTSIDVLIEHIFYRHFVDEENQNDDKNSSLQISDIRLLSQEELTNLNLDFTIHWREEDINFGTSIIFAIINDYNDFVDYIKEASEHWQFDRIMLVDRTVIMIAAAEFAFAPDVPVKVSINEALELAKAYSTEKSPLFVNGMLEKIKTILEGKNMINKSARGLK